MRRTSPLKHRAMPYNRLVLMTISREVPQGDRDPHRRIFTLRWPELRLTITEMLTQPFLAGIDLLTAGSPRPCQKDPPSKAREFVEICPQLPFNASYPGFVTANPA